MGNLQSSIRKTNFEDVQYAINNPSSFILINTLNNNEQDCLIYNSICSDNEEEYINDLMNKYNYDINIIIYGKHTDDENIMKKYNQLCGLKFKNVYIYQGGLFEWLLLQDIYGSDEFRTTSKQLDILKFKPSKKLNVKLLEY